MGQLRMLEILEPTTWNWSTQLRFCTGTMVLQKFGESPSTTSPPRLFIGSSSDRVSRPFYQSHCPCTATLPQAQAQTHAEGPSAPHLAHPPVLQACRTRTRFWPLLPASCKLLHEGQELGTWKSSGAQKNSGLKHLSHRMVEDSAENMDEGSRSRILPSVRLRAAP